MPATAFLTINQKTFSLYSYYDIINTVWLFLFLIFHSLYIAKEIPILGHYTTIEQSRYSFNSVHVFFLILFLFVCSYSSFPFSINCCFLNPISFPAISLYHTRFFPDSPLFPFAHGLLKFLSIVSSNYYFVSFFIDSSACSSPRSISSSSARSFFGSFSPLPLALALAFSLFLSFYYLIPYFLTFLSTFQTFHYPNLITFRNSKFLITLNVTWKHLFI